MTITISGLGGRQDVEVDNDATIGSLRELGFIPAGAGVRLAGAQVGDYATVEAGAHYVTTPPAAKHGNR